MSLLRCFKCTAHMFSKKKHPLSQASDELLKAIKQWTGQEASNEDCLCATCWEVASQCVIDGKTLTPDFRYSNYIFCITCGKSLRRIRKRLVHRSENTRVEKNAALILQKWVEPRKIELNDEVCYPCWLRASRAAKRYLPTSEVQFELAVLENSSVSDNSTAEVKQELADESGLNHESPEQKQFKVKVEPMEVTEDVEKECESTILTIPPIIEPDEKELYSKIPGAKPIVSTINGRKVIKYQTESVEDKNDLNNQPPASVSKINKICDLQTANTFEKDYIMLPNIRRAPASESFCIFDKCKEQERCRVPICVRQRVLLDYNFFIPSVSRICSYHLEKESFHELYTGTNALSNFDAQQIEEMILLASQTSSVDLRSPDTIQSDLFEYFLGFTPLEYEQMIQHFPQLNDQKIKCGINAMLCKLRTGDSNKRISKLFKMPCKTLESYMNNAKNILKAVDLESYVKANCVEKKTTELNESTGQIKEKSHCNTNWRKFMALVKAD